MAGAAPARGVREAYILCDRHAVPALWRERRFPEEEILREGVNRIWLVETGITRRATPVMIHEIFDMDTELGQAARG
jgi:hypothetical protein